jgi:predicted aconitase
MPLRLTDDDRAMLSGDMGEAKKMAMSILTRMAEVSGAEELLDISNAHIDSTIYIGDAGLEFAERLASLGAKVSVPTTLNVSGLDEYHWKDWAVPEKWAQQAHRQMVAYQSMGTLPTWTCAPYQRVARPAFGQQIAWGESNAIAFANSVLGARTERYPDLFDICCAITGRAPAVGLHLTENRAGQVLFRLKDIPANVRESDSFYPVLGVLIGKLTLDKVPVIEGIEAIPTEDQLKAFGAGAASAGGVALFHMVGVTPEAPTTREAFHDKTPGKTVELDMEALEGAWRQLTHAESNRLDMVVLGCPHFSMGEFERLAALVSGRSKHACVRFVVTTNRATLQRARERGLLGALTRFGAQFTVDTCFLATPMLPPEIKRLMTNSPKFAYYTPGLLDRSITFGNLAECVDSAVAGEVIQGRTSWTTQA